MSLIQVDGLLACGLSYDTTYLKVHHPSKELVCCDAYQAMQAIDHLIDQDEITSPELLDFFINKLKEEGWDVSSSQEKTGDTVQHFINFNH
jgi:hypothetical protein